jgi:ABC-2 type transport system permease protein
VCHELTSYHEILFRIILYSLIVYVISLSFRIVSQDPSRLFYVFLVQILITSFVPISFEIFREIQSDLFSVRCIKPIHYLFFQTIKSLSLFFTRFLTLMFPCMLIIYMQTKQFPIPLKTFPLFILSSIIAATIYHFITCIIGLCSYWMEDVKVLFYLNFTTMFSMGGFLVPVHDYPKLLKSIALWTPYPWILSYPAHTSHYSLIGLFNQLIWAIALGFLCVFVFNRVRQSQFRTG